MFGCRFMNSAAIGSWNLANAGKAYSTSSTTCWACAGARPSSTKAAAPKTLRVVLIVSILLWLIGQPGSGSLYPRHGDALDEPPSRDKEGDDERRGQDRRRGGESTVI